jgi:hypothetical protein
MWVDSGSDETQVPSWILEQPGVEVTDEEVLLSGFGQSHIRGSVALVELTFGRGAFRLRSRVVASPEGETQLPLLGHRDFFERSFVSFDAAHQVFSVAESRAT